MIVIVVSNYVFAYKQKPLSHHPTKKGFEKKKD